jgi:hypothetical protein
MGFCAIGDGQFDTLVRRQRAGIARLAAAFRIERRLRQNDADFVARLGRMLTILTVLDDGFDDALRMCRRVAQELRLAPHLRRDIEPDFLGRLVARADPRGARRILLLLHRGVETGLVDRHVLDASAHPASDPAGSRTCHTA